MIVDSHAGDVPTATAPLSLEGSYAHCCRLARRAASNFYLAFWLLPREKRRATSALYAFLRRSDDIGDDGAESDASVDERRAALATWRMSLERALADRFDDPLLPALVDTVRRYAIPREYLFDALDGVAMDLDGRRYETAAELRQYCHRVASVVGLACIHIWGFQSDAALEPARQCGLAFQWTNILRDLGEDAARGRVYLPLESLRRHDYRPEELLAGVADARLCAVLAEQIAAARGHFAEAAALPAHLAPDGRRVFAAMYRTYRDLLDRVERAGGDVLRRRVRVPAWRKLQLAARALLGGPQELARDESGNAIRDRQHEESAAR